MSNWFEVYDSDEVLLVTRKKLAKLYAVVMPVSLLMLMAVLFVIARPLPIFLLGGVILAAIVTLNLWMVRQIHQLRQVVWCVKLSDRRVAGYNYARQHTELDWTWVRRVELTSQSILLIGKLGQTLEVPHRFADFSSLSHRIVEYAEFYGVPVYVDGRPWDELDVHSVYPFIEGDEAHPA
jgi:hypothetical protein